MDKHADSGVQAWRDLETAAGGRYLDGRECPPVVSLFRLATSQARDEPPTAEGQSLLMHLEACAVCRRAFRAARKAAGGGPVSERPSRRLRQAIGEAYPDAAASMPSGSLFEELADAVRVPVLWRCARGRIRCVVGRRGLLLLIDPAERDGDWGKAYTLRCGEGSISGKLADDAGGPIVWGPGQPVELRLTPGDPTGTWRLEREGWSESLQFVAVAPDPGSPDAAESLLNDLERAAAQVPSGRDKERERAAHVQDGGVMEPIEPIVAGLRDGSEPVARKCLHRLSRRVTSALHDALAAWSEVAAEPLWIEQALSDTFTKVWKCRRQLPADPSRWLLVTAGTTLYEIAQRRRATEKTVSLEEPHSEPPMAKPPVDLWLENLGETNPEFLTIFSP